MERGQSTSASNVDRLARTLFRESAPRAKRLRVVSSKHPLSILSVATSVLERKALVAWFLTTKSVSDKNNTAGGAGAGDDGAANM